MGQRAPFVVALPFLVLTASTLRAQPPHSDNAHATGTNGSSWIAHYREPAARLIGEAMSSTFAWQRLAWLTDTIGNRLSGTPALERAIQWAADEMKRDGLENVHTERVMVPKWVRGAESAEIVEPAHHPLVMLGLGDSVGTSSAGGEGVRAEVLVVHSFEELEAKAASARGRIVFFNAAFTNYGE